MSESDREFMEFCKSAARELFRQMMECDRTAIVFSFTLTGCFARQTSSALAIEIDRFIAAVDEMEAVDGHG